MGINKLCDFNFGSLADRDTLMRSNDFKTWDVLSQLVEEYEDQPESRRAVTSLREIEEHFLGDRNLEILIGASSVVAVAALFRERLDPSQVSFGNWPEEIDEAWELAYPKVDLATLSNLNDSERMSYVNGLVGKLFEIRVRNALNNGYQIGGLELEDGQIASLAESANQEGWDLRIEPGNELFQLKCSQSMHYMMSKFAIAQEFDPEIDAIFSADAGAVDLEGVFVSDLSSSELREQVISSLQATGDNTSEISQFMREHGDEILEGVAIVGTAISIYALVKQISRMRTNYQNGMPKKEIFEREITSMVGRVASTTPIPYAGRFARTMTDRIHFGSKFRIKRQSSALNLRDLIDRMEELTYDFNDGIRKVGINP